MIDHRVTNNRAVVCNTCAESRHIFIVAHFFIKIKCDHLIGGKIMNSHHHIHEIADGITAILRNSAERSVFIHLGLRRSHHCGRCCKCR